MKAYTDSSLCPDKCTITEIHYDNVGIDEEEAIEICCPEPTNLIVFLYNGNGGEIYGPVKVNASAGLTVQSFETNGIQNGPQDAIALVKPTGDREGEVLELISYEGAPFVANNGPANGMMSVSIGVSQSGGAPIGKSLKKCPNGQWQEADRNFGSLDSCADCAVHIPCTQAQICPNQCTVSEIHYDNDGTDAGEAVEICCPDRPGLGHDVDLYFYNGNNRMPYGTRRRFHMNGGFRSVSLPSNGIQNGPSDGYALVDRRTGNVLEFITYEGPVITAASGPAIGMTSTQLGASQSGGAPAGQSLQKCADGNWISAPRNFAGPPTACECFA